MNEIGRQCKRYIHESDDTPCSCWCHTPAFIANREREARQNRDLFAAMHARLPLEGSP